MSTSDQSGAAQLAKQIGDLYLNKSFSDVTIVVDGTELPAHRMILSQRCPYFKTMFSIGMMESTSKRIELRETPIDGFKAVLKWIYTGEIKFTQMETALEVLRLSNMYELLELEELACIYIEANCNVDNFCLVFDNIALLPVQQVFFCNYLEENSADVLAHETFLNLSKDGLNMMLKKQLENLTNVEILEAFVRWMNANPDKSEHFRNLLKLIPLNSIGFGELASIVPSDLISGNMLIEVAREQQVMYENGSIVGVDFATPKYGAKVIIGNKHVFFSDRFFGQIDDDTEEVVIDLGQRIKLNAFGSYRALLCSKTSHINIYVSTDEANWTCVVHQKSIDDTYSYYIFDECVVRFVRIGSKEPLNRVIDLSLFSAYYK